jgi:hypothetical protein
MHRPFVTAVPSVMVISAVVLRRYCAASSGPIPNTIDRAVSAAVEDQQKQTADYKPQQRKCAAERRSSSPSK